MATLEERLARKREETKKLELQLKAKESREKSKERKNDTRRQIIIGGIVVKYFPEVLMFEPKHNNAENNIEFAPLADFLSVLAADKELVARLKQESGRKEAKT